MRDHRDRIWVSPLQTKLFVRVSLYWLIYTFTLFNILFIWRLLQEGPADVGEQFTHTLRDNLPLFLSFVVIAPWIALDAVRFASHLVGPLYRFQTSMKKVAAREPVTFIHLRQGD